MPITLQLNDRQRCDLEMLLSKSFHPLDGFLNKNDYLSVLQHMKLDNGHIWTIPITLPVNQEFIDKLDDSPTTITLIDSTSLPLATMLVSKNDVFPYSWHDEAKHIFGSDDDNHPYTFILKEQWNNGFKFYLGGRVQQLRNIPKYDYQDYRLSPEQTKQYFKEKGWTKIVGFQTRNPMHRSHYELTKYALEQAGENSHLFLNPVVGVTQPCDVDYHTRVKCYIELLQYYPENKVLLSLLPLSMRMAGPREAVWHAQIRKNYGCTHFVVGRDHAGPSFKKKDGTSFFGPYDAQDLLLKFKDDIGIQVITSKLIVYATPKNNKDLKPIYAPIDTIDTDVYEINNISGTQQREILRKGEDLPTWFSFPKVAQILKQEFQASQDKGLCLYFVGLSGSGKTTLAKFMEMKFRELSPHKKITYLDGDIVRTNLSKGLGFSKEDRSTNVRRIGYVSSLVVKHGGICITANIAPYKNDRLYNHQIISSNGNMVQIWVDTPLEECEKRDVKGLYKLAREGVIKQFTGISDPFETPDDSDLKVDGTKPLDEIGNEIVDFLIKKEYIKL